MSSLALGHVIFVEAWIAQRTLFNVAIAVVVDCCCCCCWWRPCICIRIRRHGKQDVGWSLSRPVFGGLAGTNHIVALWSPMLLEFLQARRVNMYKWLYINSIYRPIDFYRNFWPSCWNCVLRWMSLCLENISRRSNCYSDSSKKRNSEKCFLDELEHKNRIWYKNLFRSKKKSRAIAVGVRSRKVKQMEAKKLHIGVDIYGT